MDKLRAGSVGIFSGKFLYFCSKECKQLFARSTPSVSRTGKGTDGARTAVETPPVRAGAPDLTEHMVEEPDAAMAEGNDAPEEDGGVHDELRVEAEEEADEDTGPVSKPAISYWFISLAFIIVQALVTGLAAGFMKFSFLTVSDRWLFLPLATGLVLHVLQTVKGLKRSGLRTSLDDLLVLFSFLLISIPFLKMVFNPSTHFGYGLSAILAPSGMLAAVWLGRMIEEISDRSLAEHVGLTSIFEDAGIRRFIRGRGLGRSTISRYSLIAGTAVGAASLVSAAAIILWHVFQVDNILDEGMWVFAAAVSISFCPRLFSNNIVASLFAGLQNGETNGVRFQGESDIEKAATVDAVVFRKRGGVADEETSVIEMIRVGPIMEESLLSLCFSCEEGVKDSEIAAAIIAFAGSKSVKPADIRMKRYYPSRGVHCTSPYGEIIIGSRHFLIDNGISLAKTEETAREWERRGSSVIFLSVDRKVQALFVLSNDIRATAAPVCERLHSAGIVPAMISGDSTRTLESIADRIGIEQVRSEISIADWPAELERIRDTGHRLAIVGRKPFKDRASMMEDLVIEMRVRGWGEKKRAGPSVEPGVTCSGDNLELVVDAVDVARKCRKYILAATGAALLTQVFSAGLALSGLVSPLEIGAFVNIVAGCLWFLHPKLLPVRKPWEIEP
ncbi:MAG: HAD family hydrolase [Pseudomonadota bacterium]